MARYNGTRRKFTLLFFNTPQLKTNARAWISVSIESRLATECRWLWLMCGWGSIYPTLSYHSPGEFIYAQVVVNWRGGHTERDNFG